MSENEIAVAIIATAGALAMTVMVVTAITDARWERRRTPIPMAPWRPIAAPAEPPRPGPRVPKQDPDTCDHYWIGIRRLCDPRAADVCLRCNTDRDDPTVMPQLWEGDFS